MPFHRVTNNNNTTSWCGKRYPVVLQDILLGYYRREKCQDFTRFLQNWLIQKTSIPAALLKRVLHVECPYLPWISLIDLSAVHLLYSICWLMTKKNKSGIRPITGFLLSFWRGSCIVISSSHGLFWGVMDSTMTIRVEVRIQLWCSLQHSNSEPTTAIEVTATPLTVSQFGPPTTAKGSIFYHHKSLMVFFWNFCSFMKANK